MNAEVRLPGVGLGADRAHKGLLSGVAANVLNQRVVVVAGLVADGAHEVGRLGVGGHVGPKGRLASKGLVASSEGALEVALSSVGH